MTDLPNAPSARQIDRLLAIMARLRDPEGGCPWDVEQTFRTIAPYTIEEAYEVADAIERDAMDELRGELGDLLFQVVFHARMAEEAGQFDFHDVARGISDKMEDRHPHVFGEATVADAAAQTTAWETRKAAERAAAGSESALDGVPHLVLSYEADLSDAASQQAAVDRVLNTVGLPSRPVTTSLRKIGGAPTERLANFEEVSRALAERGIEWTR